MNNSTSFILDFSIISEENYQTTGNKAYNLAKLIQNNFNVPNGFVIKTNAYELFLEYNNLKRKCKPVLQTPNQNQAVYFTLKIGIKK